MRAALDGAPFWLRWFVRLGWRFVLGFQPSSARNVLGWPIVATTADCVVLEQQSPLFAAALLMRRAPNSLIWATRVDYKRRGARLLWSLIGLIHRRIVPYVLRRAATS